jgi:hypothetical protein
MIDLGFYYLRYNIFRPNELVCDYRDYSEYAPNKFLLTKPVTYRDNVILNISSAYYRETFRNIFRKFL